MPGIDSQSPFAEALRLLSGLIGYPVCFPRFPSFDRKRLLKLPCTLWLAKTLSGFEINSLEACLPQVTCDNTPLCYTLSDSVCSRLFAFSARVGACGSKTCLFGNSSPS
jgi:hypothetical protein